ncbi:S8 family serine peptidase [Marinihelvus fidelis]|nr:S8 family serine peptidase [Marinihelvus fidelis]
MSASRIKRALLGLALLLGTTLYAGLTLASEERDDEFYDQLRDSLYEDDWTGNHCGRLDAFHTYIGGLYLKLALIDRQVDRKEADLAATAKPSVQRAIARQLERLAADRADMLALIQVTHEDAAATSLAVDGEACDAPNLYFVGSAVSPFLDQLPGSYGPAPRPLAALSDAQGRIAHFFSTEIVVERPMAADIASRWNGVIMAELPAVLPGEPELALVLVDTSLADPAEFPDFEAQLTDTRGAVIQVSSEQGLALLTIAAAEAAAGHMIGINWIGRPGGYEDGYLAESPTGPNGWTDLPGGAWSNNPYNWNHMRAGSDLGLGVVEAWTLLDEAGKLDNKIGIGILDGGFYPGINDDFPVGFRSLSVVGATAALNTSGLDPASPDHGTPVLNTAASAADNGRGVVGTGSPVADTIAVFTGYDLFHTVSALDQGRIAGARIANMSYGGWIPMGLEWSMAPFEIAFLALYDAGMVLVAAAGNDADNNDNQACIGDLCWETGVNWPCELSRTYCVGGLQTRACFDPDPDENGWCGGAASLTPRQRAPGSNIGRVSDDDTDIGSPGDPTVDIFAPYRVVVGPRPGNPSGVHVIQGTSFASPYVAGVAALVWATNPSLGPGDVLASLHYRGDIPRDAEGVRDPEVKLIIDPLESVSSRLDQVCPCVSIKYPVDGASYNEGQAIVPRATQYRAGANLVSADWTIHIGDSSGPVQATRSGMTAPSIPVTGDGTHTYRLVARFDNGDIVTDTVAVSYGNSPPSVELLSPLAGATLTDNEIVRLRARAMDLGYPGGMPDDMVRWYLDDNPTPIAMGDDTSVSFAGVDLGFHTLRVVADDGYASDSDFIGFTLVAGGDNAPPSIEIISPVDGEVIYGTAVGIEWVTTVDFQAVATDPDPADILQVDWFMAEAGGSLQYVGSGHQILNVELRVDSCFGSTFTVTAIVSDGVNPNRSDTVLVTLRGTEIC